jgi:hypothetical protein
MLTLCGVPAKIARAVTHHRRGVAVARQKKEKPEQEKRYHRIRQPKTGVDYSAILNGIRQIVRFEAGSSDSWLVIVKETGQEWQITPKSLETAQPE